MSNGMWFVAGFCSGIVPCLVLAAVYYLRALKRVRSIQSAVQNYRRATSVIKDTCDKVYEQNQEPRKASLTGSVEATVRR